MHHNQKYLIKSDQQQLQQSSYCFTMRDDGAGLGYNKNFNPIGD